jgi:hypothetical protein
MSPRRYSNAQYAHQAYYGFYSENSSNSVLNDCDSSDGEDRFMRLEELHDMRIEEEMEKANKMLLLPELTSLIMPHLDSCAIYNLSLMCSKTNEIVKKDKHVLALLKDFKEEDVNNKILEREMNQLLNESRSYASVYGRNTKSVLIFSDYMQTVYDCLEDILKNFNEEKGLNLESILLECLRLGFDHRRLEFDIRSEIREIDYEGGYLQEFSMEEYEATPFFNRLGDRFNILLNIQRVGEKAVLFSEYEFRITVRGESEMKRFKNATDYHVFTYGWGLVDE